MDENFGRHRQYDTSETILDVQNLSHSFRLTNKIKIQAVDNVSFKIKRGEIFSLVGESGSGKSTIARCIMNLYKPQNGKIYYKGIDTCDKAEFRRHKKELQTERQLIFQDSASALDQRMKVADIIAEPGKLARISPPRGSFRSEAAYQLRYVGMDEGFLDRYPSELSGGQRQRVSIARAISMNPELLIADEPVASLDVSVQAQIINLFRHLCREHGFAFLFIAHDLSMVEYISDRVGVMYRGSLVELAETAELFANPVHPYTRALLSAIPLPDPRAERARKVEVFDESRLITPHTGNAALRDAEKGRFRQADQVREIQKMQEMQEISPGHFVLPNFR